MKDIYDKNWIIENSKEVIDTYSDGITLRQLYYRLVARGMTNDINHYKKVVQTMVSARWSNDIPFEAFIDRERSMYGETKADEKDLYDEVAQAKESIKAWMTSYGLDRWSNQPNYIEVWIEKKALQGVFEGPCRRYSVGLAPCKGYPSLTFLNDAKDRFMKRLDEGKNVTILYFGDYDPSGEDIPRSIKDNLNKMGCNIDINRIGLNIDLIKKLKLVGVPPKKTDTRSASWNGQEAVELDAVEPNMLKDMVKDAISDYFDEDKYDELNITENEEKTEYRRLLKEYVNSIKE